MKKNHNKTRFKVAAAVVILATVATVAILLSRAAALQPEIPEDTTIAPILFQNQNSSDFYRQTMKQALLHNPASQTIPGNNLWGVIVPHHLLAADITAATLARISTLKPKRIIILSPDHYLRGKTFFTIANRDLKTAVGISAQDKSLIESLQNIPNVKTDNRIFPDEHGVGSVLPFVQLLWPDAEVTPILFRSDATASNMAGLQKLLEGQLINPNTLIIESSDFSHYLRADEANARDSQTIAAIRAAGPEAIIKLEQPQNCDSLNILYLVKSIAQKKASRFTLFIHKNSQDYTNKPLEETTSYLTYFISG